MSKPLILAFDTSAAHCAALLLCGDRVLGQCHEDMAKGQAERLFPLLEELLDSTGKQWSDLSAIGVCTGPGNFTGVRIGVSAARGLALSLNVPAVGVSMLEALAHGQNGPSTSVLDARRERFYRQDFLDGVALSEPEMQQAEALKSIKNPITCMAPLPVDDLPHQHIKTPTLAIAKITTLRFAQAPARPAPLYLRAPNAALPSEQPPVLLP